MEILKCLLLALLTGIALTLVHAQDDRSVIIKQQKDLKLKCLLLALLTGMALILAAVHAKDEGTGINLSKPSPPSTQTYDQLEGFISLDCGSPEGSSYTDNTTRINYISDKSVISSGSSETISPSYRTNSVVQQFLYLRAFLQGTRNCYTLRPPQGKGSKYLIRASFLYGNYDAKNTLPDFDVHLGVDNWWTATFHDAGTPATAEIIHIPSTDYINVCLVKTGVSTPFISTLELRHLNDTNIAYTTQNGSLELLHRLNFGLETNVQSIRYKDDLYDRIWSPFGLPNVSTVSTVSDILSNSFQVPSAVMRSANTPLNTSPLRFYWDAKNSSDQYYMYMHFAEPLPLEANQSREFNLYLNEDFWYGPIVPFYLGTATIYSRSPESGASRYQVSINKTENSTLPPIINAIEVYTVKHFLHTETDETDVLAMSNIKSMYEVTSNWQGDPCAPQAFVWDGLNCSYNGFESPRITSLNLSSSGLNGEIDPSISNLTMLKILDLSNNNLTGGVPDFLGQLTFLKTINLSGNKFTGSIPPQLLEKSKKGLLTLSVDGLDSDIHPCKSGSCKKKKNQIVVPVVASVTAVLFVICAVTMWVIKNRKQRGRKGDCVLETKNRQFTYSEVLTITNNFQKVIGKGGFGTVYHGYVGDTQVAVKMLSPSSTQGYKEFQAEASLLTSVHHKNLSTLVGYCNEGTNMGIIYEYMANGNLDMHLSDRNLYGLGWEERLRIATDAAHGLEYLHHGCKPPIVHRDVKSNNILLDEKLQAKLTDFGLSRAFPDEGDTHISTVVAGTPGYLDPEYYTSNRLTEKSDVYGFGIVLLEIITGRPAIAKTQDKTHIIQSVSSTLQNGDVRNIVDPRLRGNFDVNSAWKAVELAMTCASRVSSKRPTMDTVVMELKECLATVRNNEDVSYTESIGLMSVSMENGLDPGAR